MREQPMVKDCLICGREIEVTDDDDEVECACGARYVVDRDADYRGGWVDETTLKLIDEEEKDEEERKLLAIFERAEERYDYRVQEGLTAEEDIW